jgi:hypothetical protein
VIAYTYRSEMCVCDVLYALKRHSSVVEEFSKNKYFQFFFEPLGTKYPFIEFRKHRRIFFVISTAKNKKFRTLKEEEYE